MRIGIRALDETKPHHARALPVATRVSVMRAALSNSSESAAPLGPDSGAVAINMQPVGNAGDVAPLGQSSSEFDLERTMGRRKTMSTSNAPMEMQRFRSNPGPLLGCPSRSA